MKAIMMVVIGFIFGLGLIISGMTNPAKVINFLTYGNQWDASLIIVMAVAMLIMMLTWLWVAKKEKPLLSGTFNLSDLKKIDARLIIGSVLFGLGWGLSGICSGRVWFNWCLLKWSFYYFLQPC
ncbi:YeeE/YedE family protein [Pseudoalteromonas sp. B28]